MYDVVYVHDIVNYVQHIAVEAVCHIINDIILNNNVQSRKQYSKLE